MFFFLFISCITHSIFFSGAGGAVFFFFIHVLGKIFFFHVLVYPIELWLIFFFFYFFLLLFHSFFCSSSPFLVILVTLKKGRTEVMMNIRIKQKLRNMSTSFYKNKGDEGRRKGGRKEGRKEGRKQQRRKLNTLTHIKSITK